MLENLATKYRPYGFEDVVGHDGIVKSLKSAIMDFGSLQSFFIFAGPHGVGKTTLARIFARGILCVSRIDGCACGKCESCIDFDNGVHTSYMEMDAASHGGVDDIRALLQVSSRVPLSGRKNVIILDEAHMITNEGQNAMLKVLEEGCRTSVWVFCSTAINKILPTLRSRAVVFDLKLVKPMVVFDRLKYICLKEGIKYEEEALGLITINTGGHMRDAIVLLDKIRRTGDVTQASTRISAKMDLQIGALKIIRDLSSDLKSTFSMADELCEMYAASDVSSELLKVCVDSWMLKMRVNDIVYNKPVYDYISRYGEKLGKMVEEIRAGRVQTKTDLFALVLKLSYIVGAGQ